MSYMRDAAARRLDRLHAARDLGPGVFLDLDSRNVQGVNGANVVVFPDESGLGHYLTVVAGASAPTILDAALPNGGRAVHFASGQGLGRPDLGAGGLGEPVGYAQPNTYVFLARINPAANTTTRTLSASTTTGRNIITFGGNSQTISAIAGASGAWPGGGARIDDNEWHVIAVVFGSTYAHVFVDGFLVGTQPTNASGTDALSGFYLGVGSAGSNFLNGGDIARVIAVNRALTPKQILDLSETLAVEAGIDLSVATSQGVPASVSTTDANGINVKYWLPETLKSSGNTLVIFSHQHTGTEAITPATLPFYPLIHACVNEGWIFAASRMHGDSWGNSNALGDLSALYTLINGIAPVSKVILVGASMGGLPTALAVALDSVPNVKAAVTIDGVYNLANMHANASYTTSIRTAYGIASDGSDYSTKTAGHDPILRAASDYTDIPWLIFVSDTDTSVPAAQHGDAFATLLGGSANVGVVRHMGAHLVTSSIHPSRVIEFIRDAVV